MKYIVQPNIKLCTKFHPNRRWLLMEPVFLLFWNDPFYLVNTSNQFQFEQYLIITRIPCLLVGLYPILMPNRLNAWSVRVIKSNSQLCFLQNRLKEALKLSPPLLSRLCLSISTSCYTKGQKQFLFCWKVLIKQHQDSFTHVHCTYIYAGLLIQSHDLLSIQCPAVIVSGP